MHNIIKPRRSQPTYPPLALHSKKGSTAPPDRVTLPFKLNYSLTCPAMKLHLNGQSSDNRVSSSEAAALSKVAQDLTLTDARCRCPACRQLLRLVAKV